MLPGWCVVVTQPAVEPIAVGATMRLGYEVFYPKFIKRIRKQGRSIYLICPLLPGYFFVWLETQWQNLLKARGVHGLLTSAATGEVGFIHPAEMENLKQQCDRNGVYNQPLKKPLVLGQHVRISWGLLAGQVGVYEGVKSQKKAVVSFNVAGVAHKYLFDVENLVGA